MNKKLVETISQLKPQLTIILKGLNITGDTIKKVREVHDHWITGWIFDVTLGGTYVKDVPEYIDFIKELDVFYTFDLDAVPELKELGVKAEWLPEGCYEPMNKEVVFNAFQRPTKQPT